ASRIPPTSRLVLDAKLTRRPGLKTSRASARSFDDRLRHLWRRWPHGGKGHQCLPVELFSCPSSMARDTAHDTLRDLSEYASPRSTVEEPCHIARLRLWIDVIELEQDDVGLPAVNAWMTL